jgi:hypothetical protein
MYEHLEFRLFAKKKFQAQEGHSYRQTHLNCIFIRILFIFSKLF